MRLTSAPPPHPIPPPPPQPHTPFVIDLYLNIFQHISEHLI